MKQHKLFWQSSYDRGLDILLKMWPEIKMKFPDATLDICYGWNLFDKVAHNNPERMEWKENIDEMMQQVDITHHGRVGKKKLQEIRKSCGILAYPSYFTEIHCISVLEAMNDGLVPVTTDIAALKETNDCGVVVDGDIFEEEIQNKYLETLLEVMGDEKKFKELQQKCQQKAKKHTWDKVAEKWTKLFNYTTPEPLVSIITPTVRDGWWNIMAHNIANQTYKNIEWIIVDDHTKDRLKTARKYADKYKLNIRYIRGKKRPVKRTYGLVNANNTGFAKSKGELLVILQDFILMPERGIEMMVDVYRRRPDALIAPTDYMYRAKAEPDVESDDWFHGETNVLGDLIWKSVRILGEGMRVSDSPYEFEQNYCGIPRHIAEDLNGWYEFMDEGLGFDNTEFAFRALKKGYRIIVDDTNVCSAIDHWKPLEHKDKELYIARHRTLSNPRYLFETEMIKRGLLPVKRDEKLDNSISLIYTMPDEVEDKQVVPWLKEHSPEIVAGWMEKYV